MARVDERREFAELLVRQIEDTENRKLADDEKRMIKTVYYEGYADGYQKSQENMSNLR